MKKQIVAFVVLAVLISVTFCAHAQSLGGFGIEYSPDLVISTHTFVDEYIEPGSTLWLGHSFVPSEGAVVVMTLSSGFDDARADDYRFTFGADTYTEDYSSKVSTAFSPLTLSADSSDDAVYSYIVQPYYDTPDVYRRISSYIINNNSYGRYYNITYTLYRLSFDTSEAYTMYYNNGFQAGYNDGLADGQTTSQTLDGFLVDVFAALATFFSPLMDFEIWGVNLVAVLALLVVASLAMIIMRMRK